MILEDSDPLAPEVPVAFDNDGRPIAVVEPVYDDDQELEPEQTRDYGKVISIILLGAPDAATAGCRALYLGYMLRSPGAPGTLADLGRLLGISPQAAHKRLMQFRRVLPAIAQEIGFDG